ncbi:MAG: CsbD family protein [Cyanobacteria bacterium QH_8_48_120]|nr:MAG: CsbD family protein [Cyanobacteria bacterium QH_1_48_107]PSO55060.1 MAG: CsbD family protein [Cyanobacteria bacterium QH_10_48_56]PSO69500.1 MAG: CsbD family protein [Cyanobacteria bacterium QH_8_48_120]PSO97103.1 MAG: CsbD family protein [Cyanobacteria bacterium QS_9_48_30]
MSSEDRAKAAAKNIEGKAQEMVSELTGDPEDKAEGQEKQVEAQAQQAKENVKDEAKENIDKA